MCGLTGIIALTDRAAIDRGALAGMTAAIAHRGPDGDGLWFDPRRRVGLGHRRLSIIDLDPRAAQPMTDAEGRFHIVYNGEIYNHARLRRDLEREGARFRTDHSDTEVVIEGTRRWGLDGLLGRLEGMFAFALYDARSDTLHLVRDRLGIKPLYFTETGGLLAFASEIKALLALPGLARRLDPAAGYHYLSFLAAPAPATMFAGIAKLPAGHLIDIGPGRSPRPRRWWSPAAFVAREAAAREACDPERAAQEVRRRLEASVESHMVADVPVGVFLSGGVDSSAVLALMSRHSSGPVRSFTVGFHDDPSLNETDEARATAARLGAEHHEVLIGADDAEACLSSLIAHQDEPLADWVCIPLWHVARLAAATGTKAVLVGEGADELFFGYPAYLKFLRFAERTAAAGRFAPGVAGALLGHAARIIPRGRLGLAGLADHLIRGLGGREVFWTGAVAWWEAQKQQALRAPPAMPAGWPAYGLRDRRYDTADSFAVIDAIRAGLAREAPGAPRHAAMQVAELALRLPELLLMRIDKMTMAHSLEARVPFLDHGLVEHVLGLDRATLIGESEAPKALLKAAVADLVPAGLLARPKRGFGAPVAAWLRGDFGARLEAEVMRSPVLEALGFEPSAVAGLFAAHRAGRDLSLHLWPLINLALWYETWIEGRPA
jgi:asparagine synthase (glutamine-hydrolysing)